MNANQIMQMLNSVKQRYGTGADPQQIIRQLMNTGQISQTAYDNAVRQAQQFQSMFAPSVHRR